MPFLDTSEDLAREIPTRKLAVVMTSLYVAAVASLVAFLFVTGVALWGLTVPVLGGVAFYLMRYLRYWHFYRQGLFDKPAEVVYPWADNPLESLEKAA